MSTRIVTAFAILALIITAGCNSDTDPVSSKTQSQGSATAVDTLPVPTPVPTNTPYTEEVTKFDKDAKFIQLTSIDQEVPNYQKNICAGVKDVDPHLLQLDSEKISCLIDAGKTNAPLLLVGGEASGRRPRGRPRKNPDGVISREGVICDCPASVAHTQRTATIVV